jgi:ABC-type transporter Mla subunit MlaD
MGAANIRRRRSLAVGLLAGAALALYMALSSGGGHRAVVVVPRADDVIAGLRVRAAGRPVGTIEQAKVTPDHQARLVLRLDDSVWPLPADSRLQLRFGGTIKYTDRYLELRRGRSATMLSEGGQMPAASFQRPVEFDQFFGTFDRPTRASLQALLDRGGPAFADARHALPAALDAAPPAYREVAEAFRGVGGDSVALDTLVRSGDSVVDAIHRADPGLASLVADAATTFDSLANESRALQQTLAQTPATLVTTRRVLARADGTLVRADRLARDSGRGVARLRKLTGPLAQVLDSVVQISPDARRTLATARAAGPDLDALLNRTTDLMPALGSVTREGAKQLACIRPYTPEIAGFFSNWGPGAWGSSDGKDTYVRGQLGFFPFPNAMPFGTSTFTSLYPQFKLRFPRPPGDLAGQPWYQPDCGIDGSSYDPGSDPESARTAARGSKP